MANGIIPQQVQRKVVRGPDGTPQVVTIDSQTGQEINSPPSYGAMDTAGYYEFPTAQATQGPDITKPPGVPQDGTGLPGSFLSTAQGMKQQVLSGQGDRQADIGTGNYSRSQDNNYGYVNTPGILGLASRMPGAPGLIGKAVSLGMNVNNVAAVNAARKDMGLEPQGLLGMAKGAIAGNKGQVGVFDIGGLTHSVGLTNYGTQGAINLTPQQAVELSKELGFEIQNTTPQQLKDFNTAYSGQSKGIGSIFDGIGSRIGSFVDGLFGRQPSLPDYYQFDTKNAAKSYRDNVTNFSPSKTGFMDMLDGTNSSNQGGFPDAPSGGYKGGASFSNNSKSDMDGISPGASAAIGAGKGGLY